MTDTRLPCEIRLGIGFAAELRYRRLTEYGNPSGQRHHLYTNRSKRL